MKLTLDVECYINYFLVLLKKHGGKFKAYEQFDDEIAPVEEREQLFDLLKHPDVTIVTFNGNAYDVPMLTAFLSGATCEQLKVISNDIINNNLNQWSFYAKYALTDPKLDHIDLIEVAPGKGSLKTYGGRLHAPHLEDLPYPHDAELDEEQCAHVYDYCKKDLIDTEMLLDALGEQLELRERLGEEYGLDLRSRSNAQIAEQVLAKEFNRQAGYFPPKSRIAYDHFYYEPPGYIKFKTDYLKEMLDTISQSRMDINPKTGHVIMPAEIEKLVIKIGSTSYKIGIGGLHSQEKEVSHYADKDTLLIDRDVASYYPQMIINMDMNPGSFGNLFIPAYEKILKSRLEAKSNGEKVKSESLKIVLNGTFGKTANKYSKLYSPKLMVMTTLTGQLSILMLIEVLELYGIPVVSANTDGVVVKCPVEKAEALDIIISKWETHTNLKTEETIYKSLHSRDVNNYFAVTEKGGLKRKGVYGEPGLSKNPANTICSEAVAAYLSQGTPVEKTILECDDIRRFVTVRAVTGGAHKDGKPIGKTVRWYYAKGVKGEFQYIKTGNAVPRSEGAKPLMDLPDELPDDLDYDWYIKEAKSILMDVGVLERPFIPKVPRKNSKKWKELAELGDIVEGKKGKWEWANQDAINRAVQASL